MSAAVDAVIAEKKQVYADRGFFDKTFKTQGDVFCKEVPFYDPRVIECTKDICNYIYQTHGRFPAHVDAMYVPGVWLQAHHLDLAYYDQLYREGYTETQGTPRAVAQWRGRRSGPVSLRAGEGASRSRPPARSVRSGSRGRTSPRRGWCPPHRSLDGSHQRSSTHVEAETRSSATDCRQKPMAEGAVGDWATGPLRLPRTRWGCPGGAPVQTVNPAHGGCEGRSPEGVFPRQHRH